MFEVEQVKWRFAYGDGLKSGTQDMSQALDEKLRQSKALEFLYEKRVGPLRKFDIRGKVSA